MNFLVTHHSGRVSRALAALSLLPAQTVLFLPLSAFQKKLLHLRCLPLVYHCLSMAQFSCSKTILAVYIFASSITQSTVNVHFLVDFAVKFSLNSTLFIADLDSGGNI